MTENSKPVVKIHCGRSFRASRQEAVVLLAFERGAEIDRKQANK